MSKNWVDSLLKIPGYNLMVRVPKEFIQEHSTDKDIVALSPNSKAVFDLILNNKKDGDEQTEKDAINVYGIIHAKFLETDPGRNAMLEKYQADIYERCPRILCKHCMCLPYGVSSKTEEDSMKWFCPNCSDLYEPKNEELGKIDGAWFGPNYVKGFLNEFPGIIPADPAEAFEPRIFGFRLYPFTTPKDDK